MFSDVHAAQVRAIALLSAAHIDDDECAKLATEVALEDVDSRVLVAFCLMEACWSWAPSDASSDHPVAGPVLVALRNDDRVAVRRLLREAMTGKSAGSYGALLVQLAYVTVRLVGDIEARLGGRGLDLAVDPQGSRQRPAGPGQ